MEDVAVEQHDGVAGVGFGAEAGGRPVRVLQDLAEHVGRPVRKPGRQIGGGHERVAVVKPLARRKPVKLLQTALGDRQAVMDDRLLFGRETVGGGKA